MEQLKKFRKEKGFSQSRMAERLGITLSLYEKVESGRASASAAFMRRLKKAFPEVNIDNIFFEQTQQHLC